MKFEAEDPAEMTRSGQGGVNRDQGVARAISVCILITSWVFNINCFRSHS